MTLKLMVIMPAISMAPQKEISPSPSLVRIQLVSLGHLRGYGRFQRYDRASGLLTGEVQIAHAEFGACYVDGQVDFAATAEVLDTAISQQK